MKLCKVCRREKQPNHFCDLVRMQSGKLVNTDMLDANEMYDGEKVVLRYLTDEMKAQRARRGFQN